MSQLQIVVGGQFGSEGKGAVAGYLAKGQENFAAIRVAGPNAGHSVYNDHGRLFKLQQVPVAAVTNPDAELLIAPGSEIDVGILLREIEEINHSTCGHLSERLRVSNSATIIEDHHQRSEYGESSEHGGGGITKSIGSTGKGVGAARADRALRKAKLVKDLSWPASIEVQFWNGSTTDWMRSRRIETLQIEGTQGYGLGQDAGHYPYCTSSNCRAVDFCSMAGVSPWSFESDDVEVWVTMRTYPIRVAGNSGPMHKEITWSDLSRRTGIADLVEKTTVTNKVRRVGEWDKDLARKAVMENGGSRVNVAMMFMDYVFPELRGKSSPNDVASEHQDWINQKEVEIGASIWLLGTSPTTIIDLR